MQFIIPQQKNQPKCRNLRSTGTPQLLCPSLHHLTLPEGLGSWARAPDGEPLPSLKWAHAGLWGHPVESREAPTNSTVSLSSQRHNEKLPEVTGTHGHRLWALLKARGPGLRGELFALLPEADHVHLARLPRCFRLAFLFDLRLKYFSCPVKWWGSDG